MLLLSCAPGLIVNSINEEGLLVPEAQTCCDGEPERADEKREFRGDERRGQYFREKYDNTQPIGIVWTRISGWWPLRSATTHTFVGVWRCEISSRTHTHTCGRRDSDRERHGVQHVSTPLFVLYGCVDSANAQCEGHQPM